MLDGAASTLAVVEVDDQHAIPWSAPDDWNVDPAQPMADLLGRYRDGFYAGFDDGSVRFVRDSIATATLNALVTCGARENVYDALERDSLLYPIPRLSAFGRCGSAESRAKRNAEVGARASRQATILEQYEADHAGDV